MRVLCTCVPGDGHFNPMLPLARALAAAGHQVAFATSEAIEPHVVKAGFEFLAAGISLPDQLAEARRRFPDQAALLGAERFENFVPRMLGGVAAPPRIADLMPIVEQWRPDVVVHDETELGGPVAAAGAGIPHADHSVGILRPLSMFRLARQMLEPVYEHWGVELGPYAGIGDYLYLDVCPPSLQSAWIDQIPAAHPMQNAAIPPDAGEQPPAWLADLADRPTLYVSLGTVFNNDPTVFRSILEGVREEPVNVIATVGRTNDPADLGPQPDHVHVERYISQALLLPHCDVVVNQGGTAILSILAEGLPMIVVPQGANQFHNAAALEAAGVGRSLLPGQVTADSVRAELRALLDDPGYRERARHIASEIAAMPGPAEGVRLVERLVEERQPLVAS
ncbi:MAG TPA: glycosyltransferase [Acidimicrobiales bacterium]|jgi:UDP:flavonoid glycosyltransferase YjiC (YdhE family)|nr:glycosyltransferase [Acidimicrobiales bacterium]